MDSHCRKNVSQKWKEIKDGHPRNIDGRSHDNEHLWRHDSRLCEMLYRGLWLHKCMGRVRQPLKAEFNLPEFPLLYTTSALCRLRYGWSFGEATSLKQVAKCSKPMLFIHGDTDNFVPSGMVYPLFNAKPQPKELWITKGTAHAKSYKDYPEEYSRRVAAFVGRSFR